jgi:hypothetical protein
MVIQELQHRVETVTRRYSSVDGELSMTGVTAARAKDRRMPHPFALCWRKSGTVSIEVPQVRVRVLGANLG